MATPRVHCTIVELTGDQGAGLSRTDHAAKELPPWADPFIAQLVDRYRLRAALDDSLSFLQSMASHELSPSRDAVPVLNAAPSPGAAFTIQDTLPIDDDLQADVEGWPW